MFQFMKNKSKETNDKQISIYNYIIENINSEGKLPYDFTLPSDSDDELKFASGAMDGIGIYHMAERDVNLIVAEFIPLLESALIRSDKKTEQTIKKFLKQHSVLRIIDPLSDRIRAGQTKIQPNHILKTAYLWATESDNSELVKLGLSLLGLLDVEKDDKYRSVILTLGKCDEFTLYSLVAISGWEDGRELTFHFAKTLDGWGKIHTVERLNPQTQEERDWMLKYGCSNEITNAYLGITCAEQGDMITALRQEDMDDDMFFGIGVIIEALFDEGPVDGISVYEYAEEAIKLYLKHAVKFLISTDVLHKVLTIKEYYENDSEIKDLCVQIIEKEDWQSIARKDIDSDDRTKFASAWTIADKLGYNIDESLYRYIEKNPLEGGWYISPLMKNPEYRDRIIAYYEQTLPLDKIASGMGDQNGVGKDFNLYSCLHSVIQALSPYPLLGVKLVQTGLASPVVSNRSIACFVLESWQTSLNHPISVGLPKVADQLRQLLEIEVIPEIKEQYRKLLG